MKYLMRSWQQAEPLLYGWLLKQTGNKQETEDLMQEIFLKAMANSQLFCSLQDGKAWLFKISKNHLIDSWRRKIDMQELEDFVAPTEETPAITQLQRCLPHVLTKLAPAQREIIEQCDLNGLAQAEYAQQIGINLSAAKARLRRARQDLKQKLIIECGVIEQDNRVCCFKGEQ